MFVTNKFGANTAITGKTTDYRQDDEKWWQVAKRDGLYVEDIAFDESAGIYSISIGIGIKDEEGNFIGALKLIYNAEDLFHELKDISTSALFKKYKKAKFSLLTRDGKIIFSTQKYKLLEDMSHLLPPGHFEDDLHYIEKKRLPQGDVLVMHTHSMGYKDFKGLGWTSVVEFDLKEIFSPVRQLEKTVWVITILIALVATLTGIFISINIRKPIIKLSNAAKEIGGGKRDVPVEIHSKDEVGELAASFKKMMESLAATTASRDELMQEITRREETEKDLLSSRANLAEAQRVANMGFWDWDILNNTLHWSDETYRIFGKMKDNFEVSYEAFLDAVHPDDRELVQLSIKEALAENRPYIIDHRIVLPDGTERFVHEKGLISFDEERKAVRMLGTILDITERKRTEKKLHDVAEEMEWKNMMLKRAKEEAEKAQKQQEKIMGFVVHDLKTPITSIIGFLEIMSHDSDHTLHKEHESLVEIMQKSSKNMLNMVEDLLEASYLQSGKIKLNPTFLDGHAIAKFSIDRLRYLAREKELELVNEVPEGTRLYADPDLFARVIQNLLSNAIKFCKKGDHVNIFVPPGKESAIAVKDTGVGIHEKILPHLFGQDEQTTTPGTAGEKGTGLGLPFVHEVMRLHGGTTNVESEPDKGSTFTVELPTLKPRILVVEDDREACALFQKAFIKRVGADVFKAENGKEALTLLNKHDIHLVVADVRMPVMDGFEMLEQIRKKPETDGIPVILVTAQAKESKEKAFNLGASGFITKPVDMERLVQKVRRYVG